MSRSTKKKRVTKRPNTESTERLERRPKPRVRLRRRLRLYYASLQDFIEVITENISESGMYIDGHGIQPVGVTFEFSLLLIDGFTLIEGTAEVMWLSFDEDGMTNGMGVRFVELEGGSARFVRGVVAENIADGGAAFDLNNRPKSSHTRRRNS